MGKKRDKKLQKTFEKAVKKAEKQIVRARKRRVPATPVSGSSFLPKWMREGNK